MARIKHQDIQRENNSLHILAILGLFILIAVYAISTVARFSISPEIGMAFVTFESVNHLSQVLHKFVVFNETWYRPFTFYLINYFAFHWIDIHNIYLFKSVGLAIILLNAYVVTILAKVLFKSTFVERVIIFSLIVTHPLYYSIAYEGSGITDPVFAIFLNLFVIFFIGLIYKTKPRHNLIFVVLCCIFTLVTITSQERGLAIFLMIGGLTIYSYRHQCVSKTFVLLYSVLVFCLYMYFVYGSKQSWNGSDYRTDFELTYIIPNLIKGIELPLRFMFLNMNKGYDIHKEWGFNLLALPFTLSLLAYFVSVYRSNDTEEKSRLIILTILFLSALPLPILFGGNVWHFYTAALYVSIVMGRAFWFWCQRLNKEMQTLLLSVFFIGLSVATVRGIHQELDETGLGHFMSLLPQALTDKTLKQAPFIPEVVYYDTGGYGDFTWPFGGKGNVFKFIYKNPAIIEIALVHGKVAESDKQLCNQVKGKKTLYYGYDLEHLSWYKIPEKNYCAQSG